MVEDAREFDLEVVRGAIACYNALHSDLSEGETELRALSASVFGWVPRVLQARAEREGMEAGPFKWDDRLTMEEISAIDAALLGRLGALRLKHDSGTINLYGRRVSVEKWYEEILHDIPFRAGLRIAKGKAALVVLPLLTNLARCVGYAIAAVQIHHLEPRIRPCAYLRDERPGSLARHYYLAKDVRQEYCTTKHSNLSRQYKWRKDHDHVRTSPRK